MATADARRGLCVWTTARARRARRVAALAGDAEPERLFVDLPVKVVGGYARVALRFPQLATAAQRNKGAAGVSFDLAVDTGSTVDVVAAQVARELALTVVGEAPAGTGAAGVVFGAAPMFLLGDVQDDTLPPEERFTLLSGMQAASVPVPLPAGCAGLIGRPFLDSFGAAEFLLPEGKLRLHAPGAFDADASGLASVTLVELGAWNLFGCTLVVDGDGVEVPALVDTGAPATILNGPAASLLGLDPPPPPPEAGGLLGRLFKPPVSAVAASPASRTVELAVARPAGAVALGQVRPCVGDVPGFAALGIGEGEPGAILGLDALCKRRFVLSAHGGGLMLI